MAKKMKLKQCIVDIPSLSRRLFTVIIMMVASVLCTEAQTLINGIYYTLNSTTATATVTSGSTLYSGDVVIPSHVTYGGKTYTVSTIGSRAFYNCKTLSSVSIPSSVNKIHPEAFYFGCNILSKFTVDSQNSWYTDVDGVIYSKDKKQLIRCPIARNGKYIIPDYVEIITASAFQYCKISEVTIPNSVTQIGQMAFFNCNSLESIHIPASVNELAGDALSACMELSTITVDTNNPNYTAEDNVLFDKNKTILYLYPTTKGGEYIIPNTVTELGEAFHSNKYTTSVTIPKSVTKMTYYSFGDCYSLKKLLCLADVPPTINKYTFYNTDKSILVYVPASSIEAYKKADYWSEFTNFQAIAEPAKTEWRISDRTDIDVDFHSINEAMEDERVQDGHTLYIERGSHLTDATITKKVTIVGPGYDLADDSRNAKVDFMIINAENAKVVGLQVQNVLVCNNNVNIENCYITNSVRGDETSYENDNCVIKSCFIDGSVYGRGEDGTYEWTLTNNIIKGEVYNFEEMTLNHNTIVSDNYVLNRVNTSTVINNVLFRPMNVSPISDCTDNEYNKNIVSAISGTNGEEWCETLSKIISCTGDASSEDYYTPVGYSLGFSTDGTDCGAFGGSEPYVKGGKSGLFVEREGEGGDEPEPTFPETPIVKGKLDNTATLDIVNDVYNSLDEFLKALATRGIASGTEIEVADQTFNVVFDETSYGYIQTAAVALELQKAYIYMKADNQAVFNITLSPTFAATHATEVDQIAATIVTFANHIITTNITITINGQPYRYVGFQVEPNDLLNLKNLYQATDGVNWTHRKWSFLSNGRLESDFPGVTFSSANELGYSRVVELDLVKNNMKGDISQLTLYFPELTSLNLYYNQLSGDITQMVSQLSKLTYLDISYNMLTGLTRLPETVTSLNKGYQFRGDVNQGNLSKLSAATVYISDKQSVGLPTIMTYDLKTNTNVPTTMYISERSTSSLSAYYGQLVPHSGGSTSYYTSWTNKPYTYEYAQDHKIYLRTSDGTIYPAILKFETGDANMSGYTDLLDVQTTITEILNPAVINLFNKTAANTYEDEHINVQDVVSTVNIVLNRSFINTGGDQGGTTEGESMAAMRRAAPVEGGSGNWIYVKDERVWLENEAEVGAVEIVLDGLAADEVSLALSRKDFQMGSLNTATGSHHIIYSLTGKTIPAGTTSLLRLSSDEARLTGAELSTPDAKALDVALCNTPTAIRDMEAENGKPIVGFSGNDLLIVSPRDLSHAKVCVTSISGEKRIEENFESIHAGETKITTELPAGIYIIGVYENDRCIAMAKLLKNK